MEEVRTYRVTLTSKSPLLMHWDNISWADAVDAWRKDSENKKHSKAGDDRSPPWSWVGHVYNSGGVVVIPGDNIMVAVMEAAAKILVPSGKHGLTFKDQSQSGIMPGEIGWPLLVNGRQVDYAKIHSLVGEMDFGKHEKLAAKLGFMLDVRRAKVGQSKHVRVRARFDRWSCSGTLVVSDDQITTEILRQILTIAGNRMGVGDWRPSSPRAPGPWGRFGIEIETV